MTSLDLSIDVETFLRLDAGVIGSRWSLAPVATDTVSSYCATSSSSSASIPVCHKLRVGFCSAFEDGAELSSSSSKMASLPDRAKSVDARGATRDGEELPSSKLVSISSFSGCTGVSNRDERVKGEADDGVKSLCEKVNGGLRPEEEVHGLLEDELEGGRKRLEGAGVWSH